MADVEELAGHFRSSGHDSWSRSEFYGHLNRQIADDPAVVELLTAAPEHQQLPVLLLAAVHSIVLAEPDIELARWYPTTASTPRDTDPYPAFRRLCVERSAEIRSIVKTRSVQTNEVGRSALFVPPLGEIEREVGPVALVDVGTSAGLNLQLDRFRYRYEPGGTVGDDSPVVIETGTRGPVPVPARVPSIAARVGLDRNPIDVTDPDEARWLMACVWPDQPDRFERLRGAISIASARPPRLVRGDAVSDVATVIDLVAEQGHPVVLNSWVLNYLDRHARAAYVAELDRVGASRDLTWVFAESPGLAPGLPFPDTVDGEHTTALVSARWRDGHRSIELHGRAHPHGYWLHWMTGEPTTAAAPTNRRP